MTYRKSQYPYFSLRIDKTAILKLKYLASIHGRSLNKEIEQILLTYLSSWDEKKPCADDDLFFVKNNTASYRTALRIPPETLDTLKYIAEYNGRSLNKELEQILCSHIKNWETKHKPIPLNS